MRPHPDAHNRDLDDLLIAQHFARLHVGVGIAANSERLVVFVAMDGEGEIGGAVGARVLHNHIDFDIGVRDGAQDRTGDAGLIRHAENGQLGLVPIERDPRNQGSFHDVLLRSNQGARTVDKRREHP